MLGFKSSILIVWADHSTKYIQSQHPSSRFQSCLLFHIRVTYLFTRSLMSNLISALQSSYSFGCTGVEFCSLIIRTCLPSVTDLLRGVVVSQLHTPKSTLIRSCSLLFHLLGDSNARSHLSSASSVIDNLSSRSSLNNPSKIRT